MSKQERRAKVWELQTQLYDTYGNPYIDIQAMHTMLEQLHRSGEIVDFAYCIHNRDRYIEADEKKAEAEIKAGSQRKAVKAGDPKPEHIHIELRLRDGKTASALSKWLNVPMQWVVYVGVNDEGEPASFDDKCAYLCHERQPEKAPYDYNEIVCTFDYADLMKRYVERQKRKRKSKASKAFRDEHINKIAAGEESIREFIDTYGYATYEESKRRYDNAAAYYLRTTYQGAGIRLTMLITGPSTLGKTPLAKMYACSLFPDIQNPRDVYFSTGDEGSVLQGYSGQPVIIWDDYRAVDFITQFGRKVLFNSLFSLHPEPTDFNIKYGSTVLRHTVNIVTCIDSLDTFTRELAGEYTDRWGQFHKSEEQQVLQVYKRIWGLSEVTEDEIKLMFNMGYYTPGSMSAYKQFETFSVLQNNMRALAERYAPSLYSQIGGAMFPELAERYQDEKAKMAKQITDPALIDPADLPQRIATRGERPVLEPEQQQPEQPPETVLYDPAKPEKFY